ncbi:hypothetical protein BDC45DRAFT_511425 [Circinella umbellata]|nr:hypothetical protein BDC45DRAFT_511425 [Circinella umbellata]
MFYCEEFTEDNASKLAKRLDQMQDLVLCYHGDPTDPVLISKRKQFSNPFKYKEYHDQVPKSITVTDTSVLLSSLSMAKEFLNEIFLIDDPINTMYTKKAVTMTEIQASISPYTPMFDNKTPLGFSQWCSNNDINLYGVARMINSNIPKSQEQIKKMKTENITVVGYCRKSLTKEDDHTRARLLQQMAMKLKTRFLVDRVYISPCSSANQEIQSGDFESTFDISKLEGVVGTTQDMISYIGITSKVSLVVLDFAGLTTNVNDLKQFLLDMPNIVNIIVDQTPKKNQVTMFSRDQLLNDQEKINQFDCRTNRIQRSK